MKRSLDVIEKPLEIFYEQIAKRNATGLASVETTEEKRKEWFEKFYQELVRLNFIPAGRVLYGAVRIRMLHILIVMSCHLFRIHVKDFRTPKTSNGNHESWWRSWNKRFNITSTKHTCTRCKWKIIWICIMVG